MLKPDFTTFTCPGKVAINLNVLDDSNEMSLYMADFQIKSVYLEVIDPDFATQAPSNTR